MSWFVCCHVIISACPLCDAVCRWLWLIFIKKLFWIYYSLIQSMASQVFFLLLMLREENGRSKSAQQYSWNCSGQHFSAVIWFSDLNAFAPRQLLIKGLDSPDTQAGMAGTKRKSERVRFLLYYSAYNALSVSYFSFLFIPPPPPHLLDIQ